MGTYSVADAKNRLPELIDRALKGEGVVITRHGRPVVELKPIPELARAVSPADLDWLAARRICRLSRIRQWSSSSARNPGFDVTPPELITGIITPAGIFRPQELWKHRAKLGYSA